MQFDFWWAKEDSENYTGQIIIYSYQYNLYVGIDNTQYYVYDFNQFSGDWRTGTIRTSIGDKFIYTTQEISYFEIINNPSINYLKEMFLSTFSNISVPIIIPEGIITINDNFLFANTTFNQNISLPNSLTTIQGSFLFNCPNYISTINFNNLNDSILPLDKSRVLTFNNYGPDVPAYQEGIKIKGNNIQSIKNALPDSDDIPYRKLIIVNENRK